MQPTTTRVDAVVPALISALRTALAGVQVLDGPRAAQELADTVLQVGIGNSDNAEAYSSDTEREPGLSGRLSEIITINCELTTWSGAQDDIQLQGGGTTPGGVGPLRTRLTGIIGQIDGLFRADQQLAGTCDLVNLGPRARWYALQSDTGPGVGVEFAVVARAAL